jgi:transposase
MVSWWCSERGCHGTGGSDGHSFKRGRQERIDIRVGVERRRKWSRDDRLRIVQETLADGAVIAGVARRNEVASSRIYVRRKQALAGLLDGFHQVRIVPEFGPDVALPAALAALQSIPTQLRPLNTAIAPVQAQAQIPAMARGRIDSSNLTGLPVFFCLTVARSIE